MIKKQLYWMIGLVMVLTSCQKEESTSPDETIFQTLTVSIPRATCRGATNGSHNGIDHHVQRESEQSADLRSRILGGLRNP